MSMRYISTRGGGEPQTFEQVLLGGLAPDGGLYLPEVWPQVDLEALRGRSYIDIAQAVMFPFVEGCISPEDFRRILEETYGPEVFRVTEVAPLVKLDERLYVMELFHGPTIAFKDVALQLLGRLFHFVLERRGERITIVGATSGDTGSAAIEGCRACSRADLFILHPKGRVSEVQRRQMTSVHAPHIHNIALEGTFDDCQNLVKAMFNDADFRAEMNLSAVNSINWARIMAQIVYYFAAVLSLGAPEDGVSFVVPTGNFGNVFAAHAARRMGLPIWTLGIATNRNDILTRFFETGEMKMEGAYATLSPSMDIQISSNFERYLFELLGRDSEALNGLMQDFRDRGAFALDEDLMLRARANFMAVRADNVQTLALMKECHEVYGYVLDPHTAVGMACAQEVLAAQEDGAVVLLATAHPAKFPDAVERAIGKRPALPTHLSDLFDREEFMDVQPNDLGGLQDFIRKERVR